MMFQLVLIDHFEQGFPEFLYFTDQWIFFFFFNYEMEKGGGKWHSIAQFLFCQEGTLTKKHFINERRF